MRYEEREHARVAIDPHTFGRLDEALVVFFRIAQQLIRDDWSQKPDIDHLGVQMFALQEITERHFHDFMKAVSQEFHVEVVQVTRWQAKAPEELS